MQLAHEFAPGVRVNAIAPAVVKTKFATALYEGREAEAAAAYPLGRLGVPEDIGGAAAFLTSEQAATGSPARRSSSTAVSSSTRASADRPPRTGASTAAGPAPLRCRARARDPRTA